MIYIVYLFPDIHYLNHRPFFLTSHLIILLV